MAYSSAALNNYNPQYWANQALMLLRTRKGYASRVFRGYEAERQSFGRGDVINFRKPMKITAKDIYQDALVDGDAQVLDTPKSSLTLNKHFATFFKVTDKDLTFAGDRLVTEHIAPAVEALAQQLDLDLARLFAAKIPHVFSTTLSATNASTLLAGVRKVTVQNLWPRDGQPHTYVASPSTMALMLQNPAFTQFQGADGTAVAAQVSGDLGMKFGFSWYETTNVITTATIAAFTGDDSAALTSAAIAVSSTSVAVDGFGATDAIVAGTIITIGGDKYVVAANVTMVGTAGTITLETGTRVAYADNTVVAVLADALGTFENDIVFHPSAAALVVAPLPMHASALGALIYTATDADTGISVRARMNYDNVAGEVNVIFDILYGMAIIDEQLAIRVDPS